MQNCEIDNWIIIHVRTWTFPLIDNQHDLFEIISSPRYTTTCRSKLIINIIFSNCQMFFFACSLNSRGLVYIIENGHESSTSIDGLIFSFSSLVKFGSQFEMSEGNAVATWESYCDDELSCRSRLHWTDNIFDFSSHLSGRRFLWDRSLQFLPSTFSTWSQNMLASYHVNNICRRFISICVLNYDIKRKNTSIGSINAKLKILFKVRNLMPRDWKIKMRRRKKFSEWLENLLFPCLMENLLMLSFSSWHALKLIFLSVSLTLWWVWESCGSDGQKNEI